jgi:hypothetical protein
MIYSLIKKISKPISLERKIIKKNFEKEFSEFSNIVVFTNEFIETNIYPIYETYYGGEFADLKYILQKETPDFKMRAQDYELSSYPDYQEGAKPSGNSACYRYVLVRVEDGELIESKQFNGVNPDTGEPYDVETTNNKNLVDILINNGLIPENSGNHLFIFGFYCWNSPSYLSDYKYDVYYVRY